MASDPEPPGSSSLTHCYCATNRALCCSHQRVSPSFPLTRDGVCLAILNSSSPFLSLDQPQGHCEHHILLSLLLPFFALGWPSFPYTGTCSTAGQITLCTRKETRVKRPLGRGLLNILLFRSPLVTNQSIGETKNSGSPWMESSL